MPTLYEYSEKSDKQGNYIRASVGGDTPITLQVSTLATYLFELTNYSSGDTVPSKFVWSMYDVGLVYTLRSLEIGQEKSSSIEMSRVINHIEFDNSISEEEEANIVSKLENYRGPRSDEVQELIYHISGQNSPSTGLQTDEFERDLVIDNWCENPEEFESLSESIMGYDRFVEASIQTFSQHPYLSTTSMRFTTDGKIEYELAHEHYSELIRVRDCRSLSGYNYEVLIEHTTGGVEQAWVSNGHIQQYQNDAGRLGMRSRVSSMLSWIIPDEEITVAPPEEIGMNQQLDGEVMSAPEMSSIKHGSTVVGYVDRISNSGNPVVTSGSDHIILDKGEPGEKVLFEIVSDHKGKVIDRMPRERLFS